MIPMRTISLHHRCKLIVFLFFLLLTGCDQQKNPSSQKISIIWSGSRAIAITIPFDLLEEIPRDLVSQRIFVRRIPGEKGKNIAGEFEFRQDSLLFKPLIPFTRGLKYQVFSNDKEVAEISIPPAGETPKVVAVYPQMESLPENLLKFYIQFSKPMAEGHAVEFVSLKNAKGDTLRKIFLDLQPELWNEDGTLLTLWLDPGRIKRDLQPNKLLGPPLINGQHYTLLISRNWPDQEGALLTKAYSRNIQAVIRDTISPSVDRWKFNLPKHATTEALEIDFLEPLDYFLALHTIHIQNLNSDSLIGNISISDDQRKLFFTPHAPWTSGRYKIVVENILEDLAGNNLNRPFDRDISNKNIKTNNIMIFEREFVIP